MSPSFAIPYVAPNSSSWGPPNETDDENPNAPRSKFSMLPYAPFGRSDRLGRVADFTGRPSYQRGGGNSYYGGGRGGGRYHRGGDNYAHGNVEFQYKVDAEEESSFQLVDTAKTNTTRRYMTPSTRRRQQTQAARLRQVNARRNQQQSSSHQSTHLRNHRRGGRGRGGRGHSRYTPRVDRQASVSVQPDWVQVEELDLAKLVKNLTASTAVPTPEDVLWCGFLDHYNDSYDKVSTRQPVSLKRNETREFYPVTTTDDPVLEKLAIDGNAGNVFCTDAILSHLMTCTRSVYPWDIVIQKLSNGFIFFDKRDNSQFDFLTVHETAHNPPPPVSSNNNNNDSSDDAGMNTPERLGLEATMIHQNFSQQILKSSKAGRKVMELPNPFFDPDDNEDGMEPASVAYRYRKFNLDDDTQLVCRTELHGLVKKSLYMTAFALNEYIPVNTNNNNNNNNNNNSNTGNTAAAWREKLDSQRGAVLATELKNNSFKLAKWTAQSLLAGADQMKIGFVSRASPKNAYEHVILATQFYRPKDFATQITLAEAQMWALIRMFVALVRKQPQAQAKYVLLRDPNKALLRLYHVPPGTFEEEEDDDDDEQE